MGPVIGEVVSNNQGPLNLLTGIERNASTSI